MKAKRAPVAPSFFGFAPFGLAQYGYVKETRMSVIRNISFASLAMALLAGCAATGGSKFACPNPTGVTCMSPMDVYQATNHADEVKGVDPKEAARLSREGRSAGKVAGAEPAQASDVVSPARDRTHVVSSDRKSTRLNSS